MQSVATNMVDRQGLVQANVLQEQMKGSGRELKRVLAVSGKRRGLIRSGSLSNYAKWSCIERYVLDYHQYMHVLRYLA